MNTARLMNYVEKGHYPFRAWPHVPSGDLLFPGCSFPSMFPRTMDATARLCRGWGMGVAYDCCGRSLVGYGFPGAASRVLGGLEGRLASIGCRRVVTLCPNCLDYLAPRLPVQVVSIYDYLVERGFESMGPFRAGVLFTPCPDKGTRRMEAVIRGQWDLSRVTTLEHVGCCGLRPDILSRGQAVAARSSQVAMDQAQGRTLYTYCSSCLGQFSRCGYEEGRHVLSVLLGIDEAPDSAHALANRARRRFDRNLDPLAKGVC